MAMIIPPSEPMRCSAPARMRLSYKWRPAPGDPQAGRAGRPQRRTLLAQSARLCRGPLIWGAEPPKPPRCLRLSSSILFLLAWTCPGCGVFPIGPDFLGRCWVRLRFARGPSFVRLRLHLWRASGWCPCGSCVFVRLRLHSLRASGVVSCALVRLRLCLPGSLLRCSVGWWRGLLPPPSASQES